MLSIKLTNPDTLALHGYVALSSNNQLAKAVETCETAAHFRSTIAAAQVRDRFKTAFPYLMTVQDCNCLTGLAYQEQLNHP